VVPEHPEQIGAVGFVDPIERREAAVAEQRARRALRRAYAALPLDDRRLLYLRFQRQLSVASIATLLDTPAKPLYVRLKRVLRTLRQGMGQPGAVCGLDRTDNGESVSPVVH